MNFLEKLNLLMTRDGYNKNSLSKASGIPYTTIDNWFKRGYDNLRLPTVKKLCVFFDTSLDFWLKDEIVDPDHGKTVGFTVNYDEMECIKKYRFISEHSPDGKKMIDAALNREFEITKQLSYQSARIAELEKQPAAVIDFNRGSDSSERILQYFHSVSAGTGQVLFDDVYSERITIPDIPAYRRVAYAVKVSGHSMEPLYSDGDMLLVEPTCEVNIGEIGIFNVDGQAYVKKLGETELISLNSGYGNIPLTEGARCMGRVVDKFAIERS